VWTRGQVVEAPAVEARAVMGLAEAPS
jgi:hypothetical protein